MNTDIKTERELAARVLGYTFLYGGLIKEPSIEFLKQVKESKLLTSFPYQDEGGRIQEGINIIASYLNKSLDYSDMEEQLNIDYTMLFIMPEKTKTHPWESVQFSGRLFSLDETLDVRKHYAKHGILPENLNLEPDDHIAFELQFMKILSEKTLKCFEKSDYKSMMNLISDQKDFMEQHLLRWAEQWASSVYKQAHTDFYKGIALILPQYLNRDYQQLCQISEELYEKKV